jgi:hypothetical protein
MTRTKNFFRVTSCDFVDRLAFPQSARSLNPAFDVVFL